MLGIKGLSLFQFFQTDKDTDSHYLGSTSNRYRLALSPPRGYTDLLNACLTPTASRLFEEIVSGTHETVLEAAGPTFISSIVTDMTAPQSLV